MVYHDDELWSAVIPIELLVVILERFTCAPDCIRFGAVCKLWHAALAVCKHHLNPSVPLILLLPPRGDTADRELVDITTAATKSYKLPSTHNNNSFVMGSSFGWLVTVECGTYVAHLFNPLTGAQIQLPPITTFANFHKDLPAGPFEVFAYKAVLSSIPGSACVVMAIHGKERQLSFCRIGDGKWTSIPLSGYFSGYQDVIFHKGKFFAATSSRALVVCELDPIPRVIEVAPIPLDIGLYKKYLVESSGELLMATRYHEWEDGKTAFFEIHKLNVSATEKWEEITCLEGEVLFLGNSGSISLSTHEAQGCKPNTNSIYFLDDNWDWLMEPFIRGMGVYGCEDYKINPLYSPTRSWPCPLFWFTPAPW